MTLRIESTTVVQQRLNSNNCTNILQVFKQLIWFKEKFQQLYNYGGNSSMKKIYLVFVCIIAHLNSISAQINDSIIIYAELDSITDELIVKQEFKIYNHSQKTLKETRLHSWANAYSGRITTLNKTKLEDRKGHLHFSEKHQRGGINDLKFYDEHSNLIAYETSEREFIKMNLKNPWKNGQKIKFTAEYKVKIPFDAVTQYGKSNEGDYLLKYFFLQPATIDENGNWMMQHYKDFEEVSAYPTTYVLTIDLSENYHLLTDLEENENYWSSSNIDHFRIFITPNEEKFHTYIDEKTSLKINFGFPIDAEDKPIIDSLLSHQLILEIIWVNFQVQICSFRAKQQKKRNSSVPMI